MKIGIIGASLAGLVAGEKLAKAGHDVTVIEKDRILGGRLATHEIDGNLFDYGLPFLSAEGPAFKKYLQSQVDEGILQKWADQFPLHDGSQLHKINPNRPKNEYFAGKKGLNAITGKLKRWVDVKSEEQAGGLTHIGADRGKKRAWMINLTDISVFECDAVIIATPAPQAYGLLLTAQDETPARRIIRVVDEIQYQPRYSLMATYNEKAPDWKGIECEGETLRWIGNESSKQDDVSDANITIHSSARFARNHYGKNEEDISRSLLDRASEIVKPWMSNPKETKLHFWKYYRAVNPIDEYFIEMEMEEAPLALIGDYLMGDSAESAYLSGTNLADYWINKYKPASIDAT